MNTYQKLSKEFKIFAADCTNSSPLYELLTLRISENKEILTLCKHVKEDQPVPNILLGAVHYLLLSGTSHPLGTFFPSITENPRNNHDVFPYFLDFIRQYQNELIPLMQVKLVQTNEVRRCAYLYPIFCLIYDKVKRPLSLVEIGTSAGLQLLWDQYSYSYGTNEVYGNPDSKVHLTSVYKGKKPPLHRKSPPIESKVGFDLHINDTRNKEDFKWLQALIWPEHQDRHQLLMRAAACFQEKPVELIEGNGIHLLLETAEKFPDKSPICIFHTHVANQIPEDEKYELMNNVKELGQSRKVFHIYNNMWDGKLHLDYIYQGVQRHYTVGRTDSHGRWFEWELPDKF